MNIDLQALRELIETYEAKRNQWIARFHTDSGFDQWFREQSLQIPIKLRPPSSPDRP
jgi:hypothetical protein